MSSKAYNHILRYYIYPETKNEYEVTIRCKKNPVFVNQTECIFEIYKNGKIHNRYGCTQEFYDACARDEKNWKLDNYGDMEFLTYIGAKGKKKKFGIIK